MKCRDLSHRGIEVNLDIRRIAFRDLERSQTRRDKTQAPLICIRRYDRMLKALGNVGLCLVNHATRNKTFYAPSAITSVEIGTDGGKITVSDCPDRESFILHEI
jgi:hypothetical protein